MATYAEIEQYVQEQSGFTPKSCWIAHVLSDNKLTTRLAYNRQNTDERKSPCPVSKRSAIEAALRYFKMI